MPGIAFLIIRYGKKDYNLLDRSFENEDLVVKERNLMKEQIRLNHLSQHFSNLGSFLRIARCAVRKDPDLQIEVRTNYMSVYELCLETAYTLNEFQRNSNDAIDNLQTTYNLVKKSEENKASKILKSLQEMAETMKKEADSLAQKSKDRSRIIRELGNRIVQQRGEIMKEKESNEGKMEDLNKEMQQTNKDTHIPQSQMQKSQADLQSNINMEGAIEQITKLNENNSKRNRSEIKNILKQLEYGLKSSNQMYETVKQFVQQKGSSTQELMVVIGSLEVAVEALDNIDIIMQNVGSFWDQIQGLCKSMSCSMDAILEVLPDMESQPVCQSDYSSFWNNAFKSYIKWFTLMGVCSTTVPSVNDTIRELESYITEDPNEEKTYRDIKEMAEQLMKRHLPDFDHK